MLPHWLRLCDLRPATDVRGKTQPRTNRAQSVIRKRATPSHIRASKNFFRTVWSNVLAQHDRGRWCSPHLGHGFFSKMAMESVLWSIHSNAFLLIESPLKRSRQKQHSLLCSLLFLMWNQVMREARFERQIINIVNMPICVLTFLR